MTNSTATPAAHPTRIPSIDIFRGAIMILMALDHVRVYFSNAQFSAVDLDQTNILLFLTRWVTHFCAPGFFFIAGVGVAYMMAAGRDRAATAKFLLSRGIWLVVLEMTVIGFAWGFTPGWLWMGVIWALGWSFVLLAGLIYLPRKLLLVGSLLFIALHPLIYSYLVPAFERFPTLGWAVLYTGGPTGFPLLGVRVVLYSLLPWAAIMVAGFAVAPWFMGEASERSKRLIRAGIVVTVAFVLLRLTNLYGNYPILYPSGASGLFEAEGGVLRSLMSFLNTAKYPPSFQFALMTLGPALLFMGWLAKFDGRPGALNPWLARVQTVGRVPFFFYVIHIYLIHALALAVALVTAGPLDYLIWKGNFPSIRPPDGYGYDAPVLWVIWAAVIVVLYFACKWFAPIKRSRKYWWLAYL